MSNGYGLYRGGLIDCSGLAKSEPTEILAADAHRQYFVIQNIDPSLPLWVNFDKPSSAGPGSFKLLPGGVWSSDMGFIPTGAVSVVGGGSYTAKYSSG